MKKLFLILIPLIFISCGVDHTDFSGDWIDKKNESDRMVIKKNGDNYIVENRNKKYPAQIKDGLLEISAELPIKATIDDNDNLIVSGSEYVRFENSDLLKFIGKWKTENCYDCEELNIEYNKEDNSFSIKYGDDDFYQLGPERTDLLMIEKIRYRNKRITGTERFGVSDFNLKERYSIKLELIENGTNLKYSCSYKDNPEPSRIYTK